MSLNGIGGNQSNFLLQSFMNSNNMNAGSSLMSAFGNGLPGLSQSFDPFSSAGNNACLSPWGSNDIFSDPFSQCTNTPFSNNPFGGGLMDQGMGLMMILLLALVKLMDGNPSEETPCPDPNPSPTPDPTPDPEPTPDNGRTKITDCGKQLSVVGSAANDAYEVTGSDNTGFIRGKEGKDILAVSGNGNTLTLIGGKGGDMFEVGGSNNKITIKGGDGKDSIKLAGSRADWEIKRKPDGTLTMKHKSNGTVVTATGVKLQGLLFTS